MDKLKPCPFCGEKPDVRKEDLDDDSPYTPFWYVECDSTDCDVWPGACGNTEAGAIELWNRRKG